MTDTLTHGPQVGRSLPRLEAKAKVSGRAEYTHVMRVPGMLYAKIVRSTVPHGEIVSIDVAAARAMPGVYGVYTGEDVKTVIPDPYYGPAFHDQPILALGKVHYIGEPVAAVLADDPHVAEAAAQNVVVSYRELPAVFDEIEATNDKVLVHEELKPATTFADLKHLKGRRNTNCALDFKLRRGDTDNAFASAARVFEHTFRTQKVLHLSLEPLVSIADATPDHVTLYTSSQGPSFVRTEIARLLGWPENRVRVKVPYLGGGYGAKLYIKMEAMAVALSLLARHPVKVALTIDEVFYTITKHPSTFRIKTGVDKNGRIVARKCDVWWNGGAYADIGPRVTQKSGFTASGPYDIDNVSIDSYAMYTNLPPAGALRGFGIPQLVWAYESHTDIIARALGRDPLDFRKQNLLRTGRPHATGTIMKDAAIEAVLDRIAARLDWSKPFDRGEGVVKRGRGLAVGLKAVIAPTTSVAILNISGDGSCTIYCGTIDMGQGSDTAMAQIAGEVLNIPAERIRVVLALPHGPRRPPRGRGSKGKDRGPRARRRRAGGQQHSSTRHVREKVRHAGGQHRRLCCVQTRLRTARPGHRADVERNAILDAGRCGGRNRGRYGDRAHQDPAPHQRCRRRAFNQSEDRGDATLGRRADATRLHHVREDVSRTRAGRERLACRL
jgi:CO/xanthine dehydrogenase Mo-binding subunit